MAVVGILAWTTPSAYRRADVVLATALWAVSTVLVMKGNPRVVDDLVAAGHARTPTSSVPDVADHALADRAVWLGYVTGIALVVIWGRRRHATVRTSIAAAAIGLLVPPWIVPGAGVAVLAAAALGRHGRTGRSVTVAVPAQGRWSQKGGPAPP